MTDVVLIIILVILIAFSALFSGSETAIATSNKLRIKKAAENGNKAAKLADYLSENYTRSVSTILVGNNLVNIAASSAATLLAVAWFGAESGPAVATFSMTILLLIFGETLPKIISAEYSDTIVLIIARPIRLIMVIFKPVVSAVAFLVSKIEGLWTPKDNTPVATPEELCTIVETIEEEGVFTEREGELIKSAIEFKDVTAREILTPRVDVIAFDVDGDINELLEDENVLKHSRIPVYEDRLDNIIGILSIKRLMRQVVSGEKVVVRQLLRRPIFVHMTRPISSILKEFRRERTHMAIVVDEFGGVMGILTLEDILEEIVGEIYDERDTDEEPEAIEDEKSGVYIVDGSMNIYDMFTLIDYTPPEFDSEYTTVGGWITELLDRFPEAGDKVEFKRLCMEVLEAQSMRVGKVIVTLKEEEKDNNVNNVNNVNITNIANNTDAKDE